MGGNTYYFMVRDQIIASLKDYPKTKRRLSILQFEYCHRHILTETEMINAMALAPRSADSEGSQTGTFSDNTMYIALHFQERRELLNHETLNEITVMPRSLRASRKAASSYSCSQRSSSTDPLIVSFLPPCRPVGGWITFAAPA